MKNPPIYFFSEDCDFLLKEKIKIRAWLQQVIANEDYKLSSLNFIFCSDHYLLQINQDYLKHDTYTDIITFDNSETEKSIIGDIFISVDRVRENAERFKVTERDELHRIMAHGTLHLLGYGDKTPPEKKLMTQKEDAALAARNF